MSVWKASVPFFTVSMHTKKNSPLTPFFAQSLKKMGEVGVTNIISKRHVIQEPNCKPLQIKGKGLGMEKIASLFVLYFTGCIFSLIVLVLEVIFKPAPSQTLFFRSSQEHKLHLKLELLQKELEKYTASNALELLEDVKLLIPKIGNLENIKDHRN